MSESISDMPRPGGWDSRMVAAIAQASKREWAWGSHDCATFANSVVRALFNGWSPWAPYFGRYDTELGAAKRLKRYGFASLLDAMDTHARRTEGAYWRRGDAAALTLDRDGWMAPDGAPALGIVEGSMVVVAAHPIGLRRFPVEAAVACWRLGV